MLETGTTLPVLQTMCFCVVCIKHFIINSIGCCAQKYTICDKTIHLLKGSYGTNNIPRSLTFFNLLNLEVYNPHVLVSHHNIYICYSMPVSHTNSHSYICFLSHHASSRENKQTDVFHSLTTRCSVEKSSFLLIAFTPLIRLMVLKLPWSI